MQTPPALQFLLGRENYGAGGLCPTTPHAWGWSGCGNCWQRVGSPEQGLPIIHVAGTKGKGSTAAMLAAALSAAGYRTGLYTSPHLRGIEERIRIDGRPCERRRIHRLDRFLQPAVEALDRSIGEGHPGPTFFEITTAAAMLHFAERQVQAAVLEVGLGGRLDATNVCQPLVSVITSISYDHTQQLGNTLAAIAGEKAGIIKPGVPVVSGVVVAEARDVIRRGLPGARQPADRARRGFPLRLSAAAAPGARSGMRPGHFSAGHGSWAA